MFLLQRESVAPNAAARDAADEPLEERTDPFPVDSPNGPPRRQTPVRSWRAFTSLGGPLEQRTDGGDCAIAWKYEGGMEKHGNFSFCPTCGNTIKCFRGTGSLSGKVPTINILVFIRQADVTTPCWFRKFNIMTNEGRQADVLSFD